MGNPEATQLSSLSIARDIHTGLQLGFARFAMFFSCHDQLRSFKVFYLFTFSFVCMCATCIGANRDQGRAPDPLELESGCL